MKNKLFLLTSIFAAMFLLMGASGQIGLTKKAGQGINYNTKSFVVSQVDTVRWTRDEGVTSLTFGGRWTDTVTITNVIVRRAVNNCISAVVAGDTLTPFNNFSSTDSAGGISRSATVTLAPLADEYWFLVTYADTTVGTLGTRTVKYEVTTGYTK